MKSLIASTGIYVGKNLDNEEAKRRAAEKATEDFRGMAYDAETGYVTLCETEAEQGMKLTQVQAYYSGTSGFYCQMFPTAMTCANLVRFIRSVPKAKPYVHPPAMLHCTIIFSPEVALPMEALPWVNRDVKMDADFAGFEYFKKDDKETGALVMLLTSDALTKFHEQLKALGLQHTFPDFKPHVTLCEDIPPELARELILAWKQQIQLLPRKLVFTAPVFEDIKPKG